MHTYNFLLHKLKQGISSPLLKIEMISVISLSIYSFIDDDDDMCVCFCGGFGRGRRRVEEKIYMNNRTNL